MTHSNQPARSGASLLHRSAAAGILAAAILAGGCAEEAAPPPPPPPVPVVASGPIQGSPGGIEVYFSPHGGCTDAVVRELDAAKDSVLVQAYTFTSSPIAKALVAARGRGVNVQVILDKSPRTGAYSPGNFFKEAGIPTFIDDKYAMAHNKIMVIDGRTVITGSFNFDEAAEEDNAENLLVLHDAATAARYAANWNAHLAQSVPYVREKSAEKQEGEPSDHLRRGQSEGMH